MLIKELKEDFEDNGKLDCLRYIPPPNLQSPEDTDQKSKRLLAQWTTDCAFEANYDWKTPFRNAFSILGKTIGKLVDSSGNGYSQGLHFDMCDEADMCEMVRTIIQNEFFKVTENDADAVKLNDTSLTDENYEGIFDQISCAKAPGGDNDSAQGICAVNSES